MPRFAIEHLNADQLVEAWPIVRMARAHANCGWWMSEAEALIERGGGILVARAPGDAVYGVATYAVARKPVLGRVLAVDMLISFELSRRAPARQALYEALGLLASAFDCRGIVLPLPSKGGLERRSKRICGLPDSGPQPDPA